MARVSWGKSRAEAFGTSQDFRLVTGEVTARRDMVWGGGSVSVRSMPEIWLRDGSEREHHFRGEIFDSCREGHRLTVAFDAAGANMLAAANASTGHVYFANEAPRRSSGGLGQFIFPALLWGLPVGLIVALFAETVIKPGLLTAIIGYAALFAGGWFGVGRKLRSNAMRRRLDKTMFAQIDRMQAEEK